MTMRKSGLKKSKRTTRPSCEKLKKEGEALEQRYRQQLLRNKGDTKEWESGYDDCCKIGQPATKRIRKIMSRKPKQPKKLWMMP